MPHPLSFQRALGHSPSLSRFRERWGTALASLLIRKGVGLCPTPFLVATGERGAQPPALGLIDEANDVTPDPTTGEGF